MRFRLFWLALAVFLPWWTASQDFILEGCFWACPGETADSDDFRYWSERLKQEVPTQAGAGITYLWLSSEEPADPEALTQLATILRNSGMELIIEPKLSGFPGPLRVNREGIDSLRNFCLPAVPPASPSDLADLLREICSRGPCPNLAVNRLTPSASPRELAEYIGAVMQQLGPLADELVPRVLDYPLREGLRQACSDPDFDLRRLYQLSTRDATTLSGFNLLTFVNSSHFGAPGSPAPPIEEPLLAYAYLLTNNQLGLPVIAYADYAGQGSSEEKDEPNNLRHQIDQLLLAHRQYIFNSTGLEYLNARSSARRAHYLSAPEGAGPDRALIFQMDGTNTPAGLTAGKSRDVIVAINFADTTLRVVQELNLANHLPGDRFTDILSRSGSPVLTVAYHDELDIPDAVFMEVPGRSYAIWVAGEAPQLEPSLVDLKLRSLENYVEVNWDVPAEKAVRGYAVERSINGQPYQEVHWTDAVGTAMESSSYLFLDEDVFPGEELYYRVKMVGEKEGYEYSTVERTRIEGLQLNIRMSEDQQAGKRMLQIQSSFNGPAEISIFSAKGKEVQQLSQALRRGLNFCEIDLSSLSPGVYFLSLMIDGRKRWSERIIKY